ncbi:MAG: hypothetical protein J3R72DRAFT_234420 [Linnemannia gamsii]|nr:MAG: hypothetical protein J3R72DRAFT_234420 [Linnemannia gamsii]
MDQEVNPIFEMFPNMKEFNFMDGDMLRPRFVDGLRTVANRVMTLNLLPFGLDAGGLQDVHLREILCTFHHLLHLRAPSTTYHIEDMELGNTQGRTRDNWEQSRGYGSHPDSLAIVRDDKTSVSQYKYIWASRQLRTLHLLIGDRGRDSCGPGISLRLFGYLSRMCPRLQELHLTSWYLDLRFQGGLCLLTRLRDLERIRFNLENKSNSSVQDLFWIDPTPPHQEQQPASIKDRLAYPLQLRQKDKDFQAWYRYLPPQVATAMSQVVPRRGEKRRDGSLITVEHIEDLLDWMVDWSETMTAIAARTNCSVDSAATIFTAASGHQILPIWPKLHSFCIDHPRYTRCRGNEERFKTIEEFMGKVRPHVNFQICEPLVDQYHLTTLQVC